MAALQPPAFGLVLTNMLHLKWSIGLAVFFCTMAGIDVRAESSPDVVTDPPRADFLVVPLHVHILSCADREDLDCKLAEEDVKRVVGKVNGVWHKAGVHFLLQPILREKAVDAKAFGEKLAQQKEPSLGIYRMITPADSRALPGLHVYYLHQFSVNGVFLGQGMCIVKETAKLRPVKGGIDEPLPRVTSHELGHAMGLPHRQDVTNLMASGTTGTLINQAEVEIVRGRVRKMEGAMTMAAIEAKAKGDGKEAEALRRGLEGLPK